MKWVVGDHEDQVESMAGDDVEGHPRRLVL